MTSDRPPLGLDPRERMLLERMCERAGVPFTEWECARLLTEFKRKLTESQWASLREDPGIRTPADALRTLIVFGFENRRLERLHLRARGRDRVWAQPDQQRRMAHLLGREPGSAERAKPTGIRAKVGDAKPTGIRAKGPDVKPAGVRARVGDVKPAGVRARVGDAKPAGVRAKTDAAPSERGRASSPRGRFRG